MSMGSSSSGDSGGGGMGLAGGLGAGAGIGAGLGGGGSSSGGSIEDLLKDPQVLKELSQLGSSVSGALSAHNKLSPQARNMLQQAISNGVKGAEKKREMNPFIGDMTKFITPDVAATVLANIGIPNRRMGV